MKLERNDEKLVSQLYQDIIQPESIHLEPTEQADLKINEFAAQAVDDKPAKTWRRFVVPVSLAASLLITSGVMMRLNHYESDADKLNRAIDVKKPMYLLQRSKPSSPETMIKQLNQFLQQGRIDKARELHQKFRYYYPTYAFDPLLIERLQAENIK